MDNLTEKSSTHLKIRNCTLFHECSRSCFDLLDLGRWCEFEHTYSGVRLVGRISRLTSNQLRDCWSNHQQATCGTIFPNVYRFIEALKRQQSLHNFEITQLIAGHLEIRPTRRTPL